MQALVTGAGGFLGHFIVEQLLSAGHRVRAFGRRHYTALAQCGAECCRGDLRDIRTVEAACEGVDCVFHAGGIAGIWGPWHEYYRTNVVGTRNVIQACRTRRVGRMVFTSSPSVVFDGRDQCGVDESAPYPRRWLCGYPKSKAMAERLVLRANGRDGLATCALRPHLIWGPRDTHLLPRLVERAKSGRLRQVGDGCNRVDTCYVENAAAAHLRAAEQLTIDAPLAGQAYFISQGEPQPCWQWIGRLLQVAGGPKVEKAFSLPAARRLGAACEMVYKLFACRGEPPMTRFLALELGCSHYYSIARAERDFGYRPQISTEDGLQRLADWLARQGR